VFKQLWWHCPQRSGAPRLLHRWFGGIHFR
jgi:hypothetical protein